MEKFVYTVRYSARGRVRGRNFYLRAGPVIKTIIEYSINGESPFSLVFVTYSISESCRDELSSGIKASRKAIRNGMEESFLSLSLFFLPTEEKHPDDSRFPRSRSRRRISFDF